MTVDFLAGAAGILLSLAFAYIPKLKDWYGKLDSQRKALVMLACLVIVAAASFGLACADWFHLPVTCDKAGLEQLIIALVVAVIANQSTYMIGVKPFQPKPVEPGSTEYKSWLPPTQE